MAAFLAAYFLIFSQFTGYDDEGTLLITVKAFVHGDSLYKEIWSVYGPFYYELFGGFFTLFGLAVTTDAGRTIVLFLWVGTSLLFGIAAQRLTGRLSLGADGDDRGLLRRRRADQRADAPAGPLRRCCSRRFCFFVVIGLRGRIGWSGAACGALLAALVLTKVNLGDLRRRRDRGRRRRGQRRADLPPRAGYAGW